MKGIRICSAAADEFTESLCWYSERNPEVAVAFDFEFNRTLLDIAAAPDRFPVCDERHRYVLMRRFPYQIIYRTSGELMTIIAVAHTSREPQYWSNR